MDWRTLVSIIFWVAIACAVVIPLAVWILVKIAPNRSFDVDSLTDTSDQSLAYRQWNRWELALLLPICAFATYVWYHALRILRNACAVRDPSAIWRLVPCNAYWLLLALFLGLATTAPLLEFCMRRILGPHWHCYVWERSRRDPFDSKGLNRRAFGGILIISTVGFVMGIRTQTTFNDDHLSITSPFSLSTDRFDFDQIKTIYDVHCTSGFAGIRDDPYFVIEFKDGSRWTTRQGLRESQYGEDWRIIDWLAKRANKSIDPILVLD